jgi:hypothetical protein
VTVTDKRNPFALLAAYVASLTGPGRTGPGLRRRPRRTTEVVYTGRHRSTEPPTTTDPDPKED